MSEIKTGNLKVMQEINHKLIFNAIRQKGVVSRSQLAKELNLSPTTVTVVVEHYKERGFIIETGEGASSGGRKPILVKLNPNAGQVIAIDLGQKTPVIALMNLNAEVLLRKTMSTINPKELLPSLLEAIHQLIKDYRAKNPLKLLGIGISVPGIIDRENGKVITASNMSIYNLSLGKQLEKQLQVPIIVENDANAAAYGEYLYGAGKGIDDFIYVYVGNGIGTGLVLNGDVYVGGAGGAGEFGHISFDENGPLCNCGNKGCLGKLLSEQYLLEKWGSETSLIKLARLSELGNANAIHLMTHAGRLLGRGLAMLVNIFNPSLILLGGELGIKNRHLLVNVRKELEKRSIPMFTEHVSVMECGTGLNAGIVGAGSLALNHFFKNPFRVLLGDDRVV